MPGTYLQIYSTRMYESKYSNTFLKYTNRILERNLAWVDKEKDGERGRKRNKQMPYIVSCKSFDFDESFLRTFYSDIYYRSLYLKSFWGRGAKVGN